jgi:hypothetical protein
VASHTPSTLCASVPLALGVPDAVAGAAPLVVALGVGWSDDGALALGVCRSLLPLSLLHPLSASMAAATATAIPAPPAPVRLRQRIIRFPQGVMWIQRTASYQQVGGGGAA